MTDTIEIFRPLGFKVGIRTNTHESVRFKQTQTLICHTYSSFFLRIHSFISYVYVSRLYDGVNISTATSISMSRKSCPCVRIRVLYMHICLNERESVLFILPFTLYANTYESISRRIWRYQTHIYVVHIHQCIYIHPSMYFITTLASYL